MNKIIGIVWSFVVYQLLAGFLFYQHGYDHKAFSLYFKNEPLVPILLLTVGMGIYIFLLLLVLLHIKICSESANRIPVIFAEKLQPEFRNFWEKISTVAILLIPWIGFIWMWIEFHDDSQLAWLKEKPQQFVRLYDIVSPVTSFFESWDDYRYGWDPERSVSYVPFWQPVIIMWPLTLVAIYLCIRNAISISRIRANRRTKPETVTQQSNSDDNENN